MTKIVIMQPYFIPYAGYIRLFSKCDLFVIYDCVQFQRRGWTNRNKIQNKWLTLPLKKGPRDTTRNFDLTYLDTAQILWQQRLDKFPLLKQVKSLLLDLRSSPLDFITHCLQFACETLKIPFNIFFSSDLNLPPTIKCQDRILTIAQNLNAKEFVNPISGQHLYSSETFAKHGIKLTFLPTYTGSNKSILERFLTEPLDSIKKDVY